MSDKTKAENKKNMVVLYDADSEHSDIVLKAKLWSHCDITGKFKVTCYK